MMKKIFARAGLVLACGLAASVQANYNISLGDSNLSLNVNGNACQVVGETGQPIDSITVNRNGTSATVNVTTAGAAQLSCMEYVPGQPVSSSSSSASSTPASSSSSSAGTPPTPGVDLSACGGSWPNDVIQGAVLSLSGEPRAAQSLNGNRAISFPVQTLVAGAEVKIDITANSSTLGVTRNMWISACPGGPALDAGRCSGMGVDAITLRTKQASSASALYCLLENNKQYFINVSNQNCGSSTTNCGFYRAIK
jgi:hypothetical protein